ncbi:MAG: lysozyme inhibitor LprI family protein [Enterobacteriaceae bacterium]|nr:lysozyme inhibitor LprI family protein [Enterobacteriaceae bacterium]
MKIAINSLFFLAFMSQSALADEIGNSIDSTLQKCKMNAVSSIDTVQCYAIATTAWDKELGTQYKLLMKDLPDNVRVALRDSQREWIKYRNTYYKGIEEFYKKEEGTIWTLISAESKMNVIKDKAIDLNRLRNSTNLGN